MYAKVIHPISHLTVFKILKTNVIGLKFYTSQTCVSVLKVNLN
jgi:hypothetical protein